MPVGRDRTRMQPGLRTYAARASHERTASRPGGSPLLPQDPAQLPNGPASVLLVDLLSQLLHDVRIPLAGVAHLLAELVVVVLRQAGALGDDVDHLGAGARLFDDVVHANGRLPGLEPVLRLGQNARVAR